MKVVHHKAEKAGVAAEGEAGRESVGGRNGGDTNAEEMMVIWKRGMQKR